MDGDRKEIPEIAKILDKISQPKAKKQTPLFRTEANEDDQKTEDRQESTFDDEYAAESPVKTANNAPASGHGRLQQEPVKQETGATNEYYNQNPSIFKLGMEALRREAEEPKVPGVASSLDFSVQGRNIALNTSRSASALEIIEAHKPQ